MQKKRAILQNSSTEFSMYYIDVIDVQTLQNIYMYVVVMGMHHMFGSILIQVTRIQQGCPYFKCIGSTFVTLILTRSTSNELINYYINIYFLQQACTVDNIAYLNRSGAETTSFNRIISFEIFEGLLEMSSRSTAITPQAHLPCSTYPVVLSNIEY